MTDSILLFTFSPVQTFIAEARRAEDLFNSSAILVQLAQAAAEALGKENLVYPANLEDGDVPNALTAILPTNECKDRAEAARNALLRKWREIAKNARGHAKLPTDDIWESIWKRQVEQSPPWQIFWAAAELKGDDSAKAYKDAYEQARNLLGAVKRSRTFKQIQEPGQKDSLSGQREALHTKGMSTKAYWAKAASLPRMNSRLRPEGRERLDSIGLIKRFATLRGGSIPSVSTVAAWDFYQRAKQNAGIELAAYRQTIEQFNSARQNIIYKARPNDKDWPFDGDLFFEETLTPGRMRDSYGTVQPGELGAMRKSLKNLYKKLDEQPSPYYAIIVLDGDSMGAHLNNLLEKPNPEQAHRDFSASLAAFSKFARNTATETNGGFMVYNGGDDVVCLASREKAIGLARQLADEFRNLTGCTASAGIVIAHHLTPLSIVLEEARRAEKAAKALMGKNAVCVTLLKRSGGPLVARSKWANLDIYKKMLDALQAEQISARLPFALKHDALTLAALDAEGQTAGLRYLIGRHGKNAPAEMANNLQKWASQLDKVLADETSGLPEVANWLVLARFMALDGGE